MPKVNKKRATSVGSLKFLSDRDKPLENTLDKNSQFVVNKSAFESAIWESLYLLLLGILPVVRKL